MLDPIGDRTVGEGEKLTFQVTSNVEPKDICMPLNPDLCTHFPLYSASNLPRGASFDPATQTYSARQVKNLTTEIVIGKFGVRGPAASCAEIPLARFDLVLVPGVAFDWHGHRLGRGKGFYDRILAAASGVKCGVAYDFQLLEEIPTEPHDAPVDFIATPSRCVRRKS